MKLVKFDKAPRSHCGGALEHLFVQDDESVIMDRLDRVLVAQLLTMFSVDEMAMSVRNVLYTHEIFKAYGTSSEEVLLELVRSVTGFPGVAGTEMATINAGKVAQ